MIVRSAVVMGKAGLADRIVGLGHCHGSPLAAAVAYVSLPHHGC